MPTLQIDIHEAEVHRTSVAELARQRGWGVEERAYEVGDYMAGNVVGVEHKSPGDFVGSLESKRLFQQAKELHDNFQYPIILVDGTIDEVENWGGINPQSVRGAVRSLFTKREVPVYFCGSGFLAFEVIGLVEKAIDGELPTYSPIRKDATPKEYATHLLAGLPGVGHKKAADLIAVYKTPLRALQAWEHWGDEVKGFGPETRKKVGAILNGEQVL